METKDLFCKVADKLRFKSKCNTLGQQDHSQSPGPIVVSGPCAGKKAGHNKDGIWRKPHSDKGHRYRPENKQNTTESKEAKSC